MVKQAYSQLKRDETGTIRVVFYDAETSLPISDLNGYTIVALDEQGQATPINSYAPSSVQPATSANLPTLDPSEVPTTTVSSSRRSPVVDSRGNGGAVSGMDLEPTNRFVGPNGLMGLALGDKNVDGNTGWRNSLLGTGISMAAGAALGGPIGLAAGIVGRGIVNSDGFKNKFNADGRLSGFGIGPGEPQAPEGPATNSIGLTGLDPSDLANPSRAAPVASVERSSLGPVASPPMQRIGPEAPNRVASVPSPQSTSPSISDDAMAKPSMAAFGRREIAADKYDRTGLQSEISSIADMVETDFGRTLNSGYRDPARNAKAKGASKSQHIQGTAIDVNVAGMSIEDKRSMLEAAVQSGVKGVGVYNGGRSIHLDTRKQPTTWGPKGFVGSPVSEMPDWSQNTLSAMVGAGVGGDVLPDKGPTPKSRAAAIKDTPVTSTAVDDDLAFESMPNFKGMSVGKINTTGFGRQPNNNELNAISYTLAGELTDYSPKAVANLTATLDNRISTVGPDKTFDPVQYNSLMPSKRAVTDANYKKHGATIKAAVESYYAGKNVPQNPDATHYYNPQEANPSWGGALTNSVMDAGHRIGTIPGEYSASPAMRSQAARQAEDNFSSRSLASQAGRNVDDMDKNMSGDKRTSFSSSSSSSSLGKGSAFSGSSSMSSRSKDDNASGSDSFGGSSNRSSSSSSSGFAGKSGSARSAEGRSNTGGNGGFASSTSKSMSTRSKDDNASGSGSYGGSSNKNTSSSKSSGGFANSKSMSTKSKDDSSQSKSAPSKSTSKSSGGFSNAGSMSTKSKDDSGPSKSSSSSSSGSKKSGGGATW